MAHNSSLIREGDKFNHLEVVREVLDGVYLCQCDCGDYIVCKRAELVHGVKKSCGCLPVGRKHHSQTSIIGMKYGNLKVVSRDTIVSSHWICQCDCGGRISATKTELIEGKITHCNQCAGGEIK